MEINFRIKWQWQRGYGDGVHDERCGRNEGAIGTTRVRGRQKERKRKRESTDGMKKV